MEKWAEILIPILLAEIVGLGSLIWKLAAKYGELKQADYNNKQDIDNLGKKVREIDSLTWQRLDEVENYLEDLPVSPGHSSFRRKSLNIFNHK